MHRKYIIQDFDKAANHYDEYGDLQYEVSQGLINRIDIPKSALILDCGAGTGNIAKILKMPLTALDISFEMCKQNKDLSICADMGLLPFQENSFDIVLSSLALQWVENKEKAINDMYSLIKKGGFLAVSTFGNNTLIELKDSYKALSPYIPVHDFTVPELSGYKLEKLTIQKEYPDLKTLLYKIKGVGGRFKSSGMQVGKGFFKELEEVYIKKYGKISATWEVVFIKRDK